MIIKGHCLELLCVLNTKDEKSPSSQPLEASVSKNNGFWSVEYVKHVTHYRHFNHICNFGRSCLGWPILTKGDGPMLSNNESQLLLERPKNPAKTHVHKLLSNIRFTNSLCKRVKGRECKRNLIHNSWMLHSLWFSLVRDDDLLPSCSLLLCAEEIFWAIFADFSNWPTIPEASRKRQ